MSANSKIEWTDHTFNPWIGCTKVSPACDHCYAEVSTPSRALGVAWGTGEDRRRTSEANWKEPLRWNANAGKFYALHGRRQRVFCASLADVFDNAVNPDWRRDLFMLIEATPNLDWLLLTKRIGNVKEMAPLPWIGGPVQHGPDPTNIHGGWPSHVWLGATICNQPEADRDIAKLLEVPAAVRFLSMEPLLGPVDLRLMEYQKVRARDNSGMILTTRRKALDWVIVGGESGAHARPMRPDWARSLRDQCASAGLPFLFKQWGEWLAGDQDDESVSLTFHDKNHVGPNNPQWLHHDGIHYAKVGKKAAGRLLDGRTHDGFPRSSV